VETLALYTDKYAKLLPTLNERARRLVVGADAKILGYGGKTLVHKASGLDYKTIRRGMRELEEKIILPKERSRTKGGGRKNITEIDPTITADLQRIVDGDTRGDPESALLWTIKSTRTLQTELAKKDHTVSHVKVAALLKQEGYRLQSNYKKKEGLPNPDRDQQFRHINAEVESFLTHDEPVISVDTKKKELVGNYKNNGQEWRPKGTPTEVNMHDFPDKVNGKAVPYGIFDVRENAGYVNVGINHDTGEFSVASIKRWWQTLGKTLYPHATKLLITCDAGGSNGYRLRLWKKELQKFSTQSRLEITVSHFPPGTSKWNKIEHKLFSFISINWRGKPLTSYQTIINLIASTKTKTGLRVYATLDENVYELKQRVTDKEMKDIHLTPNIFHGEWNYMIAP
jgi:hypothetical protein